MRFCAARGQKEAKIVGRLSGGSSLMQAKGSSNTSSLCHGPTKLIRTNVLSKAQSQDHGIQRSIAAKDSARDNRSLNMM